MSGKSGMYVGIAISVVIVVVIAVIGAGFYFKGNNIGDPAATAAPGMLDKIDMNLDLAKLIKVPTGGGAEVSYKEAVKLAIEYGDKFAEDADKAPHPEEDDKLKVILEKLEEGADKGLDGQLTFDALPPVSPKTEWDIHGTLFAIEEVASHAVMAKQKAGDTAGAEKDLRAGLLWGNRLFKNGEDFVAYKYAGIRSVGEALAVGQDLYMKGDATKLAATKELYAEYRKAGDRWFEKKKIVLLPDLKINCADLWNMAEHDKDKAWRIEGVMWLGVAQWTSAYGKQRTAVQSYLQEQTHSSDPEIAKYAKDALKTTREDVRDVAFHLPR